MSELTPFESQIVSDVRAISTYPRHHLLSPDDVAWICLATLMLSGAYRDLWPRQVINSTQKRSKHTPALVNSIYRIGCERFLTRHQDWLRSIGLLACDWEATPAAMYDVFINRFTPWHNETIGTVLAESASSDPRRFAIQSALMILKAKYIEPMTASVAHRSGLLRAAKRKHANVDVLKELTDDEVRSLFFCALEHDADLLFVGADAKWVVNFDRLFDFSRTHLRKAKAQSNVAILESANSAPVWANESTPDSERDERVRTVREILSKHRQRGGVSAAAVSFVLEESNQAAAAAGCGVSRRTLERKLQQIRDEIRRAV